GGTRERFVTYLILEVLQIYYVVVEPLTITNFYEKIEDNLSLLGKTTQFHVESQNRLVGNYRNIMQDTTEERIIAY
ncbi:17729_t:CDS:1, partial [Acaulospora morrowiae]